MRGVGGRVFVRAVVVDDGRVLCDVSRILCGDKSESENQQLKLPPLAPLHPEGAGDSSEYS